MVRQRRSQDRYFFVDRLHQSVDPTETNGFFQRVVRGKLFIAFYEDDPDSGFSPVILHQPCSVFFSVRELKYFGVVIHGGSPLVPILILSLLFTH